MTRAITFGRDSSADNLSFCELYTRHVRIDSFKPASEHCKQRTEKRETKPWGQVRYSTFI